MSDESLERVDITAAFHMDGVCVCGYRQLHGMKF